MYTRAEAGDRHKREGQLVGVRTKGRCGFNTEQSIKWGEEIGCGLQMTGMELYKGCPQKHPAQLPREQKVMAH